MRQLLYIIFILFGSCASNRNNSLSSSVSLISFGNGGGFTGIETKYILNKKGELSVINRDTTMIKHVAKKKLHDIFELTSKLENYKFSEPQNIYQFIEINYSSGTNRIVWNVNSNISADVKNLNEKLINETKAK